MEPSTLNGPSAPPGGVEGRRAPAADVRADQPPAPRIRVQVGLTFDDVLLVPRHSSVHPRDVSTRTRLTRTIPLNIPLISAAMDTVTEADMAIAMARAGGIGVIHKNMSIDRQAAEVDRVKRSESGMILNPITLGPDRPLREVVALMRRFKISGVPIVDGQGRLVGIVTNRDLQFERNLDQPIGEAMTRENLVTAPVGTGLDDAERGPLDILRRTCPDAQIIAGNVATEAGARELVRRGADAVKVGIGPGSICTTRVVTGVGVPQVTAIIDAVRGAGDVPIIADGGIKYSGDMVKALASGAASAMMGSMLAGTEESPGESVLAEGRRFKMIRGMGSLSAMQDGSADRYFQEGEMAPSKWVPEGIEGRVPYKGAVADVIYQMVGGLRSGMGYCGVADIPALQRDVEMIQVTSAGLRESHPHDVTITREAPNYSA